ncbi:MAG: hypothetical protein PF630_09100 [Gammaproteobacteria bacterium]|jgi:hypothetical protein|nr:hypothetical protein [Gammaproteobacteria bacterium]
MSEQHHHNIEGQQLPEHLRRRLQALPETMTPAHDQWQGIAARLQEDAGHQPTRSTSWIGHWPQALAAMLVISVLVAVVWQHLPRIMSDITRPLVSVGEPRSGLENTTLQASLQRNTNDLVQAMHTESVVSMAALPVSATTAGLQAGMQEYDLAAQQLQMALAQDPENQSLWQQLANLQLSRLNMFTVHVL